MKNTVLNVSADRWKTAQKWELDVWQRQNSWYTVWAKQLINLFFSKSKRIDDDWNYWWKEKFNNYQLLPTSFEKAIELGCGPFTNMRLIMEGRDIKEIICSDPLAFHYLTMKRTKLAKLHSMGRVIVDEHPAESVPFLSNYFDLTVIINVLDHVQDAEACLQTAIRITKPKGFLVFGQDLTNEEDIVSRKKEDVGHPIFLNYEDIGPLFKGFKPLLSKMLPREEGRAPRAHYGTYLFIGQKIAE